MKTNNIKTMGRSILSMKDHQDETMAHRYNMVNARIEKAVKQIDPEMDKSKLVAVSKTFSAEEISELLELGHRVFGENRVQEALGKWFDLKRRYEGVELHLIGPLQSNKVSDALKLFDVIETIDREKIARVLSVEMKKTGKNIPCFVQVNIGAEPQKSGIEIGGAVEFVKKCRENYGLNIVGLMCIPPAGEAPGPYFARLVQLVKDAEVANISMGMSADFDIAVSMGATHIRVGSALFGSR